MGDENINPDISEIVQQDNIPDRTEFPDTVIADPATGQIPEAKPGVPEPTVDPVVVDLQKQIADLKDENLSLTKLNSALQKELEGFKNSTNEEKGWRRNPL